MVAPEPGEPLLLYITETVDAVNMVLVAKRLEPCQHQESKGTSTSGLEFQDLEPVWGPRVVEATGSQPQRPHRLRNPTSASMPLPGPSSQSPLWVLTT
jgi:hypothetical protein